MVDKLRDYLRAEQARRRSYLDDARDEIRAENIDVLCNSCVFTVLILVGCLLVTPLIIRDWSPSPAHVTFVPAMLALTSLTHLYRRRSTTRRLSAALCVATGCVITFFGILIDTVYAPMAPSVFTPMMIVAISSLFILPVSVSWVLAGALSVSYAVAAVAFKTPYVSQFDVLSAMVSFVFSVCVVHIIMSYRLVIHEAKTHFRDLSMHDDLSRTLNKRALFSLTEDYFANAGEHAPCTLVFIDVDDLKTINDTLGHLAGDEVIRTVGELLKSSFRSTDVVGRFGGDEFLVFIPGPVGESTLDKKVASIRRRLAETTRRRLGVAATVSAGAVISETGLPEVNDLIQRADEALYESKREGKDRITVEHLDLTGEPTGGHR